MGSEADDEFDFAGDADQQPDGSNGQPSAGLNGHSADPEAEAADEFEVDTTPGGEDAGGAGSGAGAGAGIDTAAEGGLPAEGSEDGRNWFVIHCYSGYEN